jgi:alkylation response protein AidB-like acyl-CoA dehydrogenase
MYLEPHQIELRKVVRDFLDDLLPEPEVRRLMATPSGFDDATWRRLATEVGICGLATPAALGGSGGSFIDVGVVLQEMGAALAGLPYYSTVVLAQSLLLAHPDDDVARRWLPQLAAGEIRATVAITEPAGRWDQAGITMSAHRAGSGWRLDGLKSYVLDGYTADLLLVAARTAAGVSLFAVPPGTTGVTRFPLATLDQTRKQARVEFSDASAELVGAEGAAWPPLSTMLDHAAIGLAAEQLGGGERVLAMTVDYARTRIQFDRPIGSFQAIKHRCAEMLLDLETTRSAAHYGLEAAASGSPELPRVAHLVKAHCSEAYVAIASSAIQVHGGIGFTWEHPSHLYLKRAKSSELLFGDGRYHREMLATRLGM